MKKIDFNQNWKYKRLGIDGNCTAISLPHDAMILENRSMESAGGTNTGWYDCYDYEYTKTFTIPADYADKDIFFEFEGVYRNAEVYINGKKAAYRPYGYTNFYVSATNLLRIGGDNEIRVIARNADQPNSRWYSGAGIYRPVWLYVADKKRIDFNGVKIRTLQLEPALLDITVKTNSAGVVSLTILSPSGELVASDEKISDGECNFKIEVPHAHVWSPKTPFLYSCQVNFEGDSLTEVFGIRTISCTREKGFCLNGERVILRGACIHHDNGILGARCYTEAEERKIKLLLGNGYNAIRSAHNPCSKAMLDICDKLGMLVMDEYCDMWYIHKTMYDYADYVAEWYERDIADMIDKDYNHPCVIMYSLGNEVAETGQEKGIEFFKTMRAVCKKLDEDRPVTTGVNIFFNYLHSLGFGVYSDKKARENPQKKVGSEFFNNLAGLFGDKFMKTMAMLPGCDRKTRDCYAAMDVAGYNYGIMRYNGDLKKYPERIILGSETFCADAYAFWEIAKNNKGIIGDFVWAGMDYLGEVGVGSWEYKEYAPTFSHGVGWVTAGSGRIDLIGTPLGEALYTKVAFELEDKPQIAVVPVSHTGERHSPSAWKFSNAIPSWSWNGLDGKKAQVEVYSRAPCVELYVNGKKVGKQKFKKNCRFTFKTRYYSGEVVAVALDEKGNEISRNRLQTANDETILSILPEKVDLSMGEVAFIQLRYTDDNGQLKPLNRGMIRIEVEGGELLALGNACPFNALGYFGNTTDTYYGQALAVIRSTNNEVTITATDGILSNQITLLVAPRSREEYL